MRIHVEFSGGLELLFDKKSQLDLDFSASGDNAPKTLKDLVQHLKTKYLKEKPELFVQGETVRPGILVLVNDTDWELCDGIDYVL